MAKSQFSMRRGIHDLWKSDLYVGAEFAELDNPRVLSTAAEPPKCVISWPDAKRLHKAHMRSGEENYHVNAYIHCYTDDQYFDGPREGIWAKPEQFFSAASHFDGILGIDFSVYADFPDQLKRYQFHKMRVMEHAANYRCIQTIPNARWSTPETWSYCFDALPTNGMLAIGSVGSGLRFALNRPLFDAGLCELVKRKNPKCLIVVGSTNYPIFTEIAKQGIEIVQFDGETCSYFKKGQANV